MIIDSNELLGRVLGTCTLKRLIGRGGMGAVYLAQQSRPRRIVAVKVLLPGIVLEKRPRAEFLARFRREADAVAALDHVNIMPVYEYGEQEDIAYLVMPYVTGGTLRDELEQRGSIPLGEAITIIEQAAAALDSAHTQGIIHRDLKPGNILFHADGRVLLADFGLAKMLKDFREHNAKGHTLTSAGTIIGTPEYLSPEQGTGRPIDARTDVYSLGIVLYQMLTGHVPFSGASPVAIAIKHAMEMPTSLTQLSPDLPVDIEAVVFKAIAKKPEDRYASAGEFAAALRAAAQKHNIEPIPHTSHPLPSGHPAAPSEEETEPEIQKEETAEDEPTAPISSFPTNVGTVSEQPENSEPENAEETDTLHSAATEATPRFTSHQQEEQPAAVVPSSEEKTIADPLPSPALPVEQKQEKVEEVQLAQSVELAPKGKPALPRRGCQSLSMMLLGSVLTLMLVVAAVASYRYLIPPQQNSAINKSSKSQVHTTSPQPTPQRITLPKAAVPIAGQLLYGTASPGPQCDSQGGRWSSTTNARMTCGNGTTTMTNTGSGHLAGVFLETLPANKPMPSDYVVQVQVSITPSSSGKYGVFFRNQPGGQQGAFSFLLTGDTWEADTYNNTTGMGSPLVERSLQGTIQGTATIDVIVQGSTYTFYVNGVEQGYAQSGMYLTGGIGLAVDTGANVSFKNLELFALA